MRETTLSAAHGSPARLQTLARALHTSALGAGSESTSSKARGTRASSASPSAEPSARAAHVRSADAMWLFGASAKRRCSASVESQAQTASGIGACAAAAASAPSVRSFGSHPLRRMRRYASFAPSMLPDRPCALMSELNVTVVGAIPCSSTMRSNTRSASAARAAMPHAWMHALKTGSETTPSTVTARSSSASTSSTRRARPSDTISPVYAKASGANPASSRARKTRSAAALSAAHADMSVVNSSGSGGKSDTYSNARSSRRERAHSARKRLCRRWSSARTRTPSAPGPPEPPPESDARPFANAARAAATAPSTRPERQSASNLASADAADFDAAFPVRARRGVGAEGVASRARAIGTATSRGRRR
mmetsp:Transcript_11709/g.38473  ORF Transcript_11709/g.38473 Transcript_11709/m.38473 type:complete len:366 (-) Transcript_11709:57-1154(-)